MRASTLLAAVTAGILASASGRAADVSQLGKDLTPFGAITAGTADGLVPAWTGGVVKPPAGYQPGDDLVDPYAGEKPVLTITAANTQQYADKLTPGLLAMLRQYPDYKINVYGSHRSFAAPQALYDAAIANAGRAKLSADGDSISGARLSVPFPIPANGQQAIWNHLLRWRGESVDRRVDQVNPTQDGNFVRIGFHEKIRLPYNQSGGNDEGLVAEFWREVVSPPRFAGEIILVHDFVDPIQNPRQAWTYNPGQRRVRRAPEISYDTPGPQADALRTDDDYDGFNGALDRYDWKLVGRQVMYVPYNNYRAISTKPPVEQLIKAQFLNPDEIRFEPHRVWVVEATLKPGLRHIYSKRVLYLDEDSWETLLADNYDQRGQLWRVYHGYATQYYQVPATYAELAAWHDLNARRYTAFGLKNGLEPSMFNVKLDQADFTPDALRRAGVR